MKRKDLFMGNTEIPVIRTIGEIQSCLVRSGATQILTAYKGHDDSIQAACPR